MRISIAEARTCRFRYRYAGLGIASDRVLHHLPADAEPCRRPDVYLLASAEAERRLGPQPGETLFRWNGRFELSLSRTTDGWQFASDAAASFAVDPAGTLVRRMLSVAPCEEAIAEMLVHRILPRVAQLRGAHVLHASVVARDGKAAVLCAASGHGKSTLAAYLTSQRGWQLLADDACAFRIEAGVPRVYATCNTLSLFDDAADGLGVSRTGSTRSVARGVKHDCAPGSAGGPSSAEPAAIFLLTRPLADEPAGTERVAATESVALLRQQIIQFNPADVTACSGHLQFLTRVVGRVPVYVLSYPRRFEAVAEAADLVDRSVPFGRRERP
ncbi:MAG TPA: hypothetical protein VKT77_15940 [Chthonomonadaceae bacterium]|nr:hypothetical protein [Chthonomonadaceae bacterium]